jgi:hypothetical protein
LTEDRNGDPQSQQALPAAAVRIYNGTFSGVQVDGDGNLRRNAQGLRGIPVYNEHHGKLQRKI